MGFEELQSLRFSVAKVRFASEPAVTMILGVHSLNLERETSTGVLANFSRARANCKREFAELKREIAVF